MRHEFRYRWIAITLASVLVLTVVAIQIHLNKKALPHVSLGHNADTSVNTDITGVGSYGTYCTSNGEVVSDGIDTKYEIFLNIICNAVRSGSNVVHYSELTLANLHKDQMAPTKLTIWGGINAFEGLYGRRMETTLLSGPEHETIADALDGHYGCVFVLNYHTGEVPIMLSVPSGRPDNSQKQEEEGESDGRMTNRNLYSREPGSTIKIVAALCALTQDPELANFTYTCTGRHPLPNKTVIPCQSAHGSQTMSDAIGNSCNCYFTALIEQFDVGETRSILKGLDFDLEENLNTRQYLDLIPYEQGFISFSNNRTNTQITKLIGLGGSEVSMIDMTRIAAAIVNGGSCAKPHIVRSIYDPNTEAYTYQAGEPEMISMVDPDAAETLSEIWNKAVEDYYYAKTVPLDPSISHAKTGTDETSANMEDNNRFILAVMEEYNIAFMVSVEDSYDETVYRVANTVAQVIVEANR